MATISSAVGAIYSRRFAAVAPQVTAAGALTCAAVVLGPLCFLVEAPLQSAPSAAAIAALLANAVLATALGFVVYFRLIRTIGSMGAASVSYLKPAAGVLIGCTLLGETLTWTAALGLIAILTGVAAINPNSGRMQRTSTALRRRALRRQRTFDRRRASIEDAEHAFSLDHLLGAGKQYPRDHEAESLRRLEIDHKLEFRRCLHRKIRRLGAAENAAHVLRCAPELVYGIHAVRHEAPRLGKVPIGVNCRNAKLCGERDDKVTMHAHEIIRHENEAASRFSAKFRDGIFDLGRDRALPR